jgi:hypothetical protein
VNKYDYLMILCFVVVIVEISILISSNFLLSHREGLTFYLGYYIHWIFNSIREDLRNKIND